MLKPQSTGRGAFGMTREELQELLKIRPGKVLFKIAVLVTLWWSLGALVLQLDAWPLKLIVWAAMGFVINGLIQLGHETWHNNLFPAKWQNLAFGTLLGLLVGLSHEALRHDHLMHHRHNRTERDPDAYNAGKDTLPQRALFYSVALFGLPLSILYFNFLYPLQWFDRRKLPGHFLRVALATLGYGALAWASIQLKLDNILLQAWIIPILAASPYNGFKSLADHHNNVWKGDRFHTATTTRSNKVVTWFWNGLNYHLDHHLFPRVPGYNLPKLHEHLRPTLLQHNAPVYDSYAETILGALKAGPMIVEDDFNIITFKNRRKEEP